MTTTARLARNAESKKAAEHDGQPWSAEEMDILMLCVRDEDFVDAAEMLGRTIEACRQRFYVTRRGEATTTITTRRAFVHDASVRITETVAVTNYRGWMEGDGDE
jgi:hypothetical protein